MTISLILKSVLWEFILNTPYCKINTSKFCSCLYWKLYIQKAKYILLIYSGQKIRVAPYFKNNNVGTDSIINKTGRSLSKHFSTSQSKTSAGNKYWMTWLFWYNFRVTKSKDTSSENIKPSRAPSSLVRQWNILIYTEIYWSFKRHGINSSLQVCRLLVEQEKSPGPT